MLVADCGGNRVVEVDIVTGVLVDTWFQSPEITLPNCVAACSHTVGVSQTNTAGSPWFSCISLFNVATRTSRGRVVNAGPVVDARTLVFPMQHPLGLRITRDGAHFVVADNERHCIRLFRFADGAISFVQDLGTAEDGIRFPTDVEEVSDGFLVANHFANSLTKINVDGIVSCASRGRAAWDAMPGYEEYDQPSVLALLPDGGLVVKELGKGGLLRVVPRAVRVPRALVLVVLWGQGASDRSASHVFPAFVRFAGSSSSIPGRHKETDMEEGMAYVLSPFSGVHPFLMSHDACSIDPSL